MVSAAESIKGANQTSIQESNRSLLLRLLKRRGVCSRVELARLTGLKQATITNIINDMIRIGLVEETGLLDSGKGRKAIGIMLKKDAFYVIGLRLTRKFFRIGLFDPAGELQDHVKYIIPDDQNPSVIMKRMIGAVQKMQNRHSQKRILSAGVSVPGPYFPDSGRIRAVSEFPGWEEIDIRSAFENGLSIPVIVEHDANVGVLAEWENLPKDTDEKVMVYLAVGQGVGAGIIENGKVLKGAYGTAGEVGHISMNALGERCACGNRGCLTGYASTIGFVKLVRNAIREGEKSSLKHDFTFGDLAERIRGDTKDPAVHKIFKEIIVRYLGTLLVNLMWTYSPDEIVVGDEMAEIGDVLTGELRQFVRDHTLPYMTELTGIRLSSLEDDPAFLGSADLVIDSIWDRQELWNQGLRRISS